MIQIQSRGLRYILQLSIHGLFGRVGQFLVHLAGVKIIAFRRIILQMPRLMSIALVNELLFVTPLSYQSNILVTWGLDELMF